MKTSLTILILMIMLIPSCVLIGFGWRYYQNERKEFVNNFEVAELRKADQIKDLLSNSINLLLEDLQQTLEHINWEKNPSKQLNLFQQSHQSLSNIFAIDYPKQLVTIKGETSLYHRPETFDATNFEKEIAFIRQAERIELVDKDYDKAITAYQALFIDVLDPVLRARVLNCIARTYLKQNNYHQAGRYYQLLLKQYPTAPNWDHTPIAVIAYRQLHQIYLQLNKPSALSANLLDYYQNLLSGRIVLKPSFYNFQLKWIDDAAQAIQLHKQPAYKKLKSLERSHYKLNASRRYVHQTILPQLIQTRTSQSVYLLDSQQTQLVIINRLSLNKYLYTQLNLSHFLNHFYDTTWKSIIANQPVRLTIEDQLDRSYHWTSNKEFKTEKIKPIIMTWEMASLSFTLELFTSHDNQLKLFENAKIRFYLMLLALLVFYLLLSFLLLSYLVRKTFLLQKMKSEFVEHVSHELKTPLTSISMYADILHDDPDLEKKQRQNFISILQQETSRLSTLIKKILDFTKTENIRPHLNLQPINIIDHLEEAVTIFKQRKLSNEIELHREQLKYADYTVAADASALHQVWANILENAGKYSTDVKTIAIHLYEKKKYLVIEIRDSGVGMTKSEVQQIFGKYYRSRNKKTYSQEGFGLGLGIVRNILKLHGGLIDINSVPNQGTTVRIRLKIIKRS